MATTATPTQKPTAAAKQSNKPTVKKRLGNISVAVFTRDVSTSDGKVFTAKDYVLQKSWKDRKTGQWQDQSINLKQREILAVQKALDEAFVESYDGPSDDEE
jgi:hypothetical protein